MEMLCKHVSNEHKMSLELASVENKLISTTDLGYVP